MDELMKTSTEIMGQLVEANSDKHRLQTGLLEILHLACNLYAPLDRNEIIEIINKSLKYDRDSTTRKEVSQDH
jgi:hypothetical protein